ncbi:MAG: hypothetical protein VKO44_10540 [Cyanobacteriota bacterium]|nr:hypothetical protein [Cyanobacteriota bacterium]
MRLQTVVRRTAGAIDSSDRHGRWTEAARWRAATAACCFNPNRL